MADPLGLIALVLVLAFGGTQWWSNRDFRKELTDLRQKYNNLMLDYWRVVGENEWLRRQLRIHGIEIPPLPPELRPHMDEHGNINILVNTAGQDLNSIEINGQTGQVSAGRGNSQES